MSHYEPCPCTELVMVGRINETQTWTWSKQGEQRIKSSMGASKNASFDLKKKRLPGMKGEAEEAAH